MGNYKNEGALFVRVDDPAVESIRAMYATAASVGLPIISNQ